MLALVDGEPRLLPLKRALQIYSNTADRDHAQAQFELRRPRRAPISWKGSIALENLDAVIQTIRESPDADQPRAADEASSFSDLQAQAILDMQLGAWLPWNARRWKMNIRKYRP